MESIYYLGHGPHIFLFLMQNSREWLSVLRLWCIFARHVDVLYLVGGQWNRAALWDWCAERRIYRRL